MSSGLRTAMIKTVPWMESPKADKIRASIAANDAPAQVHRTATVTAPMAPTADQNPWLNRDGDAR